MAHLGWGKNEYGTEISKHRCDVCGEEFTICPAAAPDQLWSNVCGSSKCPSFNPNDALLQLPRMTDEEIANTPMVDPGSLFKKN